MHFQIFIPNATGADPRNLDKVGLGSLRRDGDSGPLLQEFPDRGPNGGPGLLIVWPGSDPVYRPGELTWHNAKPDKSSNQPAGRYMWAIDTQSPPTSIELARSIQLKGRWISIHGQTWLIPNILLLPHQFALDDDGEEVRQVCQSHEAIYKRGIWAFNHLKEQVSGETAAPGTELRRYVIEMLSLNYRIFPELAYHLGLLSDDNWFSLACATVDIETLIKIEAEHLEKKRAETQAALNLLTSSRGDGQRA